MMRNLPCARPNCILPTRIVNWSSHIVQRDYTMPEKLIGRIFWPPLISAFPKPRSWQFLALAELPSGVHEAHIWKVALHTRCAMSPVQASPESTIPMLRRRLPPWPARNLRKAPSAGHSNCWNRQRKSKRILVRSAARLFADC